MGQDEEFFAQLIAETREKFAAVARPFGFFQRQYLKVKPPSWCKEGKDALWINYRDRDELLTSGKVVWAAVVQANQLMFRPGHHDCPGTVIYSTHDTFGDQLTPVADLAPNLFSLKGEHDDDPECQVYGDMLADEMDRAMATPVPKIITGGVPILSTSVVFHRKHLPVPFLCTGFFPMLVHPQKKSCMVLPARFWSDGIIEIWKHAASRQS